MVYVSQRLRQKKKIEKEEATTSQWREK